MYNQYGHQKLLHVPNFSSEHCQLFGRHKHISFLPTNHIIENMMQIRTVCSTDVIWWISYVGTITFTVKIHLSRDLIRCLNHEIDQFSIKMLSKMPINSNDVYTHSLIASSSLSNANKLNFQIEAHFKWQWMSELCTFSLNRCIQCLFGEQQKKWVKMRTGNSGWFI